MRKQNSEFLTAFISEASRKIKNTDFFGFVELDKFACYVIADGIDDDVDAISAKLAVDTVVSSFMESPSMSKRAVRRYLRAANRALLTARSKMKLKASVTVLVTNYVKLRYGQAGNTRFRLYRDGFLRMQSRDSSLSMDLVQAEKLEQDKLAQHEERHNLFCYLGQEKGFSPYISKKFKLTNADAAALYTRGIWENVDEGELKDIFAEASDEPQPIVDSVEEMLLSRQPEGLEKYTFATIFFNKTFIDPNRKRKIKKILMIAIPILLVLAILTVILLVRYNNRKKDIAAMEQSFYDAIEYIQADNYPRAKTECQNALDLANKLKNEEIQTDASNYMKLIESVIAGDTDLNDGEYRDAQRNYLNAQNRSRYADNLGLDYIQDRLEQTGQYITVYDLIALGDTLVSNLQYDKAEEQYSAAQLLAGSIYFTEGRDSAIAALERLYESMKQDQADNAAAQQQASESQSAAASVLSEGDAAFAKGDYTSALTYYTTSLQKYTELEDEVQVAALLLKIAATEEKLAAQQELVAEAEEYMSLAEAAYGEKNYVQAKKYYLLAKDVYSSMQNDDKVAEVSRKMELVEMGISAEEEAARKAAEEEQKRLGQEQREQEETAKNAENDVQNKQEPADSSPPESVG